MGNFKAGTKQASSDTVLGAALSDGIMAGLIGGILGSILPIIAVFTRASSTASLGFLVNIFLYFATGILAGYLYYSRKIGHRWVAAVVAIIGGFLAGLISGAATGFALSQVSQVLPQLNSSTSWVMWSALSALGAGFIAPLAAWIPGFFIQSDNSTHGYNSPTTRMSTKGTKQYETTGEIFERRRKIRFVVTMVTVVLMFAWYFCKNS